MQETIIDQKQYSNLSLEELREKEQIYLLRHGLVDGPREKSEVEKAYWAKVEAAKQKNSFQQVADLIRANAGPRPAFDTPWMPYADAKKLFWECMEDIARQYRFKWELYPSLKELCQVMAAYMSGWKVEGLDFDLHKGFFIYGPCGCGKSKIMAAAQLMAYRVGRSERVFKRVASERVTKDRQNIAKYQRENWYFDDLGNTDLVFKDWGREVNPFQEIFTERHREMECNYIVTHITSNIAPESFAPVLNDAGEVVKRGVFDQRVISRWSEMFNFFELVPPCDYRG